MSPRQQGRFRGDVDVLRLLSLEIGQCKLVCLSLALAPTHQRQGISVYRFISYLWTILIITKDFQQQHYQILVQEESLIQANIYINYQQSILPLRHRPKFHCVYVCVLVLRNGEALIKTLEGTTPKCTVYKCK